jgi:hypothetical protein
MLLLILLNLNMTVVDATLFPERLFPFFPAFLQQVTGPSRLVTSKSRRLDASNMSYDADTLCVHERSRVP